MTIVKFYQEVSALLELYRSGMTDTQALRRLRSLNAEAAQAGIDAQVSEDVLRQIHIFDDENSYDEEDTSFDDED
jgi:hypothetical protein